MGVPASPVSRPASWLSHLYVQVLIAIVLGVLLGWLRPELAVEMKPLGDAFIKLIKMLIAPIVFTTIVLGIAKMGAMQEVGRIGLRALLYFEAVSTLALVIGLVVVNVLQPGRGLLVQADPASVAAVSGYRQASEQMSASAYLLHVIPDSFGGAFVGGDILQVVLVSLLAGLALLHLGSQASILIQGLEQASHALFRIVAFVMRAAPIGAFGAMAFTIGRYGLAAIVSLGKLMAGVYITCLLFVLVVLGGILRAHGFSIFKVLRYIGEEILLVLGTSSSESALPRLMTKLEALGCARPVVGLVVPTGYSFNLDGTSIYLTMAAVFVAQAGGVDLSVGQQLSILGVLLLTSKGAAGVTGSGFITLAATLATVPTIPMSALALLVGVDRFMSEARAITNLIGNAVATIAVSAWDRALDHEKAHRILDGLEAPVLDDCVAGAVHEPAGEALASPVPSAE